MNDLSFLDELRKKRILFAPLDWGLGHATRSSALIERLIDQNEIQIASSGIASIWLKNRFPHLQFHDLPSYDIRYRFKPMWLNILISLPRLIGAIRKEHQIVGQLVKLHEYDLIIADHRFGTYCKDCRSVVVAHQIQILHPNRTLALLSTTLNRYFLNRYDEVWIPDFAKNKNSLSGRLSESSKIRNAKYIGPLSMLSSNPSPKEMPINIAVILSGPEPSRSELELSLTEILESKKKLHIVLIRGSDIIAISPTLLNSVFRTVIDIADSDTILKIMSNANQIICRSGYSTIMDLEAMGLKAILIPTNNQPEQQYLAEFHGTRGYKSINEKDITQDPSLLLSLLD